MLIILFYQIKIKTDTYTLPYFSGGNGDLEFYKLFTKPRGKLVNDGSKDITLKAHFYWGHVSSYKTSYMVKIFLQNENKQLNISDE